MITKTISITRRALVWQPPQPGEYRWDSYTGGHSGPDTPGGYRQREQKFETFEEAIKPFDNEKPGSGVVVKTTTEIFEGRDLLLARLQG